MTAPAIPDELLELDSQLDDVIPCEWDQFMAERTAPCEERATWVIRWREVCAHGEKMPLSTCSFACTAHAAEISRMKGSWFCAGCRCPIETAEHVVERIVPLP